MIKTMYYLSPTGCGICKIKQPPIARASKSERAKIQRETNRAMAITEAAGWVAVSQQGYRYHWLKIMAAYAQAERRALALASAATWLYAEAYADSPLSAADFYAALDVRQQAEVGQMVDELSRAILPDQKKIRDWMQAGRIAG